MTTFDIKMTDPTNFGTVYDAKILACVQAAARDWAAQIMGSGVIDVSIDFVPGNGGMIASAGFETSVLARTVGGIDIYTPGTVSEILTGNDPNGTTPDVEVNVSEAFYKNLFYDPTELLAVPSNQVDAVTVFTHELGHALGFLGLRDSVTGKLPGTIETPFDANVQLVNGNMYYTGANAERVYGGPVPIETGDYGHIGNAAPGPGADLVNDLMYGSIADGERKHISGLDLAILQDAGLPLANFQIADTTTAGATISVTGDAYSGPVAGLASQYVYAGADSENITALSGGSFIHTGSGNDAIDVSGKGGTNVLDGGAGSNFLVGGKGAKSADTFFVDDRGPTRDIWSTVVNFHAGDSATLFGITKTGFSISYDDGQGAAGFTGLTIHAAGQGVPQASVTLSGFTQADLGNGRLTQVFGTEADGTPFLFIHGVQ